MKRILTTFIFVALTATATVSMADFDSWADAGRQRSEAKRYLKHQGISNPSKDQVAEEVATGKYAKKAVEGDVKEAQAVVVAKPTRAEATQVSCFNGVLTLKAEYIKAKGAVFDTWADAVETRQFLPSGTLRGYDPETKASMSIRPNINLGIKSDADKYLTFYPIDPDKTGNNGSNYAKDYARNKELLDKFCASEPQTIFYKDSGVNTFRMPWYAFAPVGDSLKDHSGGLRDYSGETGYKAIIDKLVRSISPDPEAILDYFTKNPNKMAELDSELSAYFLERDKNPVKTLADYPPEAPGSSSFESKSKYRSGKKKVAP